LADQVERPVSEDSEAERYVEIPSDGLAADTLRRLIEEFVTRDGTDYGASERSLEDKVVAVQRQLARGEARIVYDREEEVANVVLCE
jgi:uncharacterized protein YheU (UPF0270 family)